MTFDIYCCECGAWAGHTTCEVTATSPCMCEACHAAYLDEVEEAKEATR